MTATNIPADHPRAHSLRVREAMKDAVAAGLVHPTGLIAHGRGEAFDYLLGERTPPEAFAAIHEAAFMLAGARQPVLSLNGNVVALAAPRVPTRTMVTRVAARGPEGITVLGDNAGASTDSRVLGPLAPAAIRGRAVYRYFPDSRRGLL
jgi:hypothetical protein